MSIFKIMRLKKVMIQIIHFLIKEYKTINEFVILENVFNKNYAKKALLSFITSPFNEKDIGNSHTNELEAYTIAEILNELKFNVDVVNYDSKFLLAQDYELWSRIILKYNFYIIQQPLLYYRVFYSASKSIKRKLNEKKYLLQIYKNLLKPIDIKNVSENQLEIHYSIFATKIEFDLVENNYSQELNWIKKIYNKNRKIDFYDNKLFNERLSFFWNNLFNIKISYIHGIKSIKFIFSPLTYFLTRRTKIIFILKAIFYEIRNSLFTKQFKNKNVLYGIGEKNKKQAAIFYVFQAVKLYVENKWDESMLNNHTMYWESVEMVKILNKYGYTIDYYDCTKEHTNVDWKKYDIIIDERNNLKNCTNTKAKKIYYATGCHWLIHNRNEYERIDSFYKRTNKLVLPQRQIMPYESDVLADYITYFGSDYQKNTFSHSNAKKIPLNISSTYSPKNIDRNISNAKYHYLWLGSRGAIHKGLDIVIEAFKLLPKFHLHIASAINTEKVFMEWLNDIINKYPNIHNEGWFDIESKEFENIAAKCLGTIYVSAAEGGAGAVVQLMHFGIIPIVNKQTALRAEEIAIMLNSNNPNDLIKEIIEKLREIECLTDDDLIELSKKARSYAIKYNSKQAYSDSFDKLIKQLI